MAKNLEKKVDGVGLYGKGLFFLDFLSFIRFFVIFGCVVYVVYASSFFVVCP